MVLHIERETNLHVEYCKSFGLTLEDMTSAEEHMGGFYFSPYPPPLQLR